MYILSETERDTVKGEVTYLIDFFLVDPRFVGLRYGRLHGDMHDDGPPRAVLAAAPRDPRTMTLLNRFPGCIPAPVSLSPQILVALHSFAR